LAKVWKFGDNINTDQIIPGRYYPRENEHELGDFCLCELNPDFAENRQEGDVIVAGSNFGAGSSRETAPLALKYSGIKCVVARSFARIFYRNCINIGFPIMICDACYDDFDEGNEISVNLASGTIHNKTKGKKYESAPFPDFILKIIESGGIVNYINGHKDDNKRSMI